MEEKKSLNKMLIADIIVTLIVLAGFAVLFIFRGCNMDGWVTALGLVVVAAGTGVLMVQSKKINKQQQ